MKPLRLVLAANTLSNLGFGALFSLWPAAVAAWLGTVPPDVIFWIGIGLLINGAAMLATTLRSVPRLRDVVLFSVGDMGWWLFSMTLIAAKVWVTTPHGLAATWAVALIVAALGLAQLYILGQHRFGDTGRGPHKRFIASWLALPVWCYPQIRRPMPDFSYACLWSLSGMPSSKMPWWSKAATEL